jgi:ParB/RepB/Spo0J family partition protein
MNEEASFYPQHSRFTEIREIEIGCLKLRYAHTRVARPERVSSLVSSIERSGQIVPVITVKESDSGFVLIDGYLRVAACKRCGQDTVMAEIWACQEREALIRVLLRSHERRWETVEQAMVMRELKDRHGLTDGEIARFMDHNQSWVSRRLSLLDALPEEILEMVQKGQISTWSAARVLVPMARAMPDHAKKLTETLIKEPISTRALGEFFRHYQKANRTQREKMVHKPVLFLRALRCREEENQARFLKDGPEGKWVKEIKVVGHILRRLIKGLPTVLYPGQIHQDRRLLLKAFEETKGLMLALDEKIRRRDDIT